MKDGAILVSACFNYAMKEILIIWAINSKKAYIIVLILIFLTKFILSISSIITRSMDWSTCLE